jgi:hypothetical protein
LIDSLVRQLADRCLKLINTTQIEIEVRPLVDQPLYLVRELLIFAWRAQNWPQQSMGFAEWNTLAAMLTDPAGNEIKRMFPGEITAERQLNRLVLRRE